MLRKLGFDGTALGWARPGLPVSSNLAGPVQHFRAAILDAWWGKVAADLCSREGFRGGPLPDIAGTLQLLNSAHVRERDQALLRGVLVGGVRNGFLLGRVRGQPVPCPFCGVADGVAISFGSVRTVLFLRSVKILSFMISWCWPGCLLWHGWLPLLSGADGAFPWAGTAAQGAGNLVEQAPGTYSSRFPFEWTMGFVLTMMMC